MIERRRLDRTCGPDALLHVPGEIGSSAAVRHDREFHLAGACRGREGPRIACPIPGGYPLQDERGCSGQARERPDSRPFAAIGSHIDRGCPHRLCENDVLRPVTNDPGNSQVQIKGGCRRLCHARPRFAGLAHPGKGLDHSCRVVRAVEKQIDVLVHPAYVVDPVQAPRDAGLVREHRDGDVGPVELGDRIRRPFDELDAVDGAHVSVVDDDRAVAIEQDSRP